MFPLPLGVFSRFSTSPSFDKKLKYQPLPLLRILFVSLQRLVHVIFKTGTVFPPCKRPIYYNEGGLLSLSRKFPLSFFLPDVSSLNRSFVSVFSLLFLESVCTPLSPPGNKFGLFLTSRSPLFSPLFHITSVSQ